MPLAPRVVPSEVELKPGESQAFVVVDNDDKPVDGVTWSVFPTSVGKLDSSGVYSAPGWILTARRLTILAQRTTNDAKVTCGTATVQLDPSTSWIPILGVGWIVLFVLLLAGLRQYWEDLCPQCQPPGVYVSPPVVTLTNGELQQFSANARVSWTNTLNHAGLYVAPAKIDSEQTVSVTATSRSNNEYSGVGVVRLSPSAAMTVVPSKVSVRPGEEIQFTASIRSANESTVRWLAPAVGDVDNKGKFKAPTVRRPENVVVLAEAQLSTKPPQTLIAGALVTVEPSPPHACDSPGSTLWRVILLVACMGALGGLTHAMGSFGTYVGNRELKASWLWWYGLKPVLSAAVAVLVFLVFRAGLGAPDLGLGAGDCLLVAGFAGLVGLFAEPATVKLKDIFDALFTPRRDPREDKAGQGSSTAAIPEITGVHPPKFKASEDQTCRISGKRFSKNCIVRIGTRSFIPRKRADTELEIVVKSGDLPPDKYELVVFNSPPEAEASRPYEITVEA